MPKNKPSVASYFGAPNCPWLCFTPHSTCTRDYIKHIPLLFSTGRPESHERHPRSLYQGGNHWLGEEQQTGHHCGQDAGAQGGGGQDVSKPE